MAQPADTPTSMQLAIASETTSAHPESMATATNAPADENTMGMLSDAAAKDDTAASGEGDGLETAAQRSLAPSFLPHQAVDALPLRLMSASTASTSEGEQARQTVAQLGALVTEAASALVLDDRRWRSARRTQLRQHDDLVRFARFLDEMAAHAGLPFTDPAVYAERLATDLSEWQGISWGHVQAHIAWLLDRGYAIGTIDNALSTLKVYARLAQRAGALAAEDLTRILDLHPFGYRGGLIVDDHRPADKRRRPGAKKGQPTAITAEEAQLLKSAHSDDPRGRRDALLLTLLIDHGLRVGEVVALRLEDIQGIEGMDANESTIDDGALGASAGRARQRGTRAAAPLVLLRVHRPKVKKEQRHALTPDSVAALRLYLEVRRMVEPTTHGPLLCATHPHNPSLVVAGMTENGIHKRVKSLGRELLGVEDLGPHDLRHFWATSAARGKTAFDRLVRAGGWNSPAMPLRYIDAEEIANTGVVLDHLRQATVTSQHPSRRDPTQS